MKTEVIDFRPFMRNEWRKETMLDGGLRFVMVGGSAFLILAPEIASAQSKGDSFQTAFAKAMHILDWLVVGVFIFAGTTWMFGNRTKSIEFLIGGSVGYTMARHAIDMRDFLKVL
jgi:hypothetical protein